MILNLDKTFKCQTAERLIDFEHFTFSGGEPHIKLLSDLSQVEEVYIRIRVRSFNDMGLLCLAVNALRNAGVERLHLLIPYFPAARQDRLMVEGEPLSVKVYAVIINAQSFASVTVFDPHSEVTPALLNNCRVVNNFSFIEQTVKQLGGDIVLVSPDGGALKKIYKLAAYLQNFEVVECSKVRDVRTGQLKSFKVYADDLQGKHCLIVDDICDGGGTFMGLAQELKAKGAQKLSLAVSHGIFSRGVEALTQTFDYIFTTDSFQNQEVHTQVNNISLTTLINE